MVSVKLLGQPKIKHKGEWFEPRPSKPLFLLFYAAYSGDWLDRDKLGFLFWPDTSEVKSQQNMRRLIHRAKSLEFAVGLEIEASRLRWNVATDVKAFRGALAEQGWAKALELYRGAFLEGLKPKDEAGFEAWLEQERADLARVWRNAVHKHVETLESKAKHAEAAPLLYQLFKQEPLAEDVLQRYLRSAYLLGERDNALSAFNSFKRLLKEELDLEPLDETLELINTIKESQKLELTSLVAEQRTQEYIPISVLRPPKLIGRQDAIQEIQNAKTPTILVAGEAGIGKSRLMAELAPNALLIRCQEGLQNIPYYPVISLIRSLISEGVKTPDLKHYTDDLARLVPELAPNISPGPADPETGRSRLFEALTLYFDYVVKVKELKAIQLLIDDLQWADSSSLDFLVYLTNKQNMKVLGTYRIHEKTDALKDTIKGLSSRQLLTQVKLEPLSQETIQEFIASLMGSKEGPPVFSEWLAKGTGGNPMFMLETLKSLFEQGTLKPQEDGWQTDFDSITRDYSEIKIPAVVQEVIQRRVENLKPETQRVLQVASVVSKGFSPKIISQISGLSEWVVLEGLEEAEAIALIKQDAFQHDLLRQSTYSKLSQARKSLLHRRTAETIKSTAEPSIVAEHWFTGGELSQAVHYWLLASAKLREKGLSKEAIGLLEKAERHVPEGEDLWKIKNDLATNYKDLALREQVHMLLEPVFKNGTVELQAAACNTLAGVLTHEGKLEQAEQRVQQGLELVKSQKNKSIEVDLIGTAAIVKHLQGDYSAALNLLAPVLVELRQKPSSMQLTLTILNVAAILDQLSRHEEALPLHLEALTITKKMGDKARQIDVSLNLLYCYMDLNRTAEGITIAQNALELGRFDGTDTLRNNLAAAFLEMGESKKATFHYETLTQDSPSPTLVCVAWSRLAKLYNNQVKAQQALKKALTYAKNTEVRSAHAIMLSSIYQLGSKTQREQAQPFLNELKLDELPNHIRIDLEQALAENL